MFSLDTNNKQLTKQSQITQTTRKNHRQTNLSSMVCSNCNGVFTMKHNSRTCPLVSTSAADNISKAPKITKKIIKPLEGLAGCKNIFKEPTSFYTAKKIIKPLEGLVGCKNIFKEPKSFYTAKKIIKPLEGLVGCKNIFKEPKSVIIPKANTICSSCGEGGHNKRTCSSRCQPCVDQTARSICFAGLTARQAIDLAKNLDAVNPLN